jgi:hypothetical protein
MAVMTHRRALSEDGWVGGARLDRDDGGHHAIQTPDRPGKIRSDTPMRFSGLARA